jgi:hypothetical protein
MKKNTPSMSVSAIFYIAFAVSVLLLTSGLVIGLPTTTIQQAQATTSPSRANEHISEQGREQQSERGAERSGVREPVFCTETIGPGEVLCFETMVECEDFREAALGSTSECERFVTPPPGAQFCRFETTDGVHSLRCSPGPGFPP